MRRRDFLIRGGLSTGALAALGALPWRARAEEVDRAGRSAGKAAIAGGDVAPLGLRPAEAPAPISEAERADRRAKAQQLMGERGMAGMFVEPGPSLTYFADLDWHRSERVFGLLLPVTGEAVVISPAFEAARAALGVQDRFEIRAWQEDESPYGLMVDTLRGRGQAGGRIAVDPGARVFVREGIAGAAAGRYDVVSAAPVVELTRGVKSAHEVEIMRFANQQTLQAYQAAFDTLRPGLSQEELATTVSSAMAELGWRGGALVLFGESSAYPHGAPNPSPLKEGDVVLVDGGLQVHGYSSDITRTVVLGEPSPEARHVFNVVLEAQEAARAAARPGVPAGSVDAAARAVIDRAGFGPGYRLFTHRLGHGIGLEGHEWPYLVKGSDVELRTGMTFSDEPGIYQYGKFGIRCEDIMVITDDGAELMTGPAQSLGA